MTQLFYSAFCPVKPISENAIYANTRTRKRVLSKDAKIVKQKFWVWAAGQVNPMIDPTQTYWLHLEYVAPDWLTKDGFPRRRDVSNIIKFQQDLIATWLGIDDRWFVKTSAEAVIAPVTGFTFSIIEHEIKKSDRTI